MLLQGKVGVITGASTGIGRATALAMAREGAAVVVADVDAAEGAATVAAICEAGGNAVFETVDATDETAVARMVARALADHGRLDIAYNNVGMVSPACAIQDTDLAQVKSVYDVNTHSVLMAMKHEIPAMLESGGGAIVNASSTWGVNAGPERAAYVSSKHAICGLTKTAALELAKQNVRVNAIAPGPILTPMLLRDWRGDVEKAAAGVPMGRVGNADEVAEAVVWLCSDRASFITGHILPVDGGMLCQVG